MPGPRESQIIANGQCFRLNDGRRRGRQFSADTIRIVFGDLTGAPGATVGPETRALLDRIEQRILIRGRVVLPSVNCDKAAPLPAHLTADEKANLPKPEPVPPLK